MGSATKYMKFLEELESLELEDQISNLPESLIVHIISFLPTKHAVGTSALSRFWKNQWTSIPNLDFDDTVLMDDSNLSDIHVQTSFLNFVQRVLDLNKAPQMCQFRLKCHKADYASHLNTWISIALARNVQKLELDFRFKGLEHLPHEFFTSSTLVELRLSSWSPLNFPTLVWLPNLRAISLHYVKFADYASSEKLFSGCPVLEDITMILCGWEDPKLNISSPTVKRLAVVSSHCQYTIELNTPRLERLSYVGQLEAEFLSKSLEFLAKLYFDISCPMSIKETIKVFAKGISHVQFLYLSGEVLEVSILLA